jgi:nitrite reductase (NADH) small subunit
MVERRHNLGSLQRVPLGEGRAFEVAGKTVAVFRPRTGEVYATQAACPHRGGPLAAGLVAGGRVVCPLHGYAFRLQTGDAVQGECPSLKTYSVVVDEHGDLWLTL